MPYGLLMTTGTCWETLFLETGRLGKPAENNMQLLQGGSASSPRKSSSLRCFYVQALYNIRVGKELLIVRQRHLSDRDEVPVLPSLVFPASTLLPLQFEAFPSQIMSISEGAIFLNLFSRTYSV